MGMGSPVTNDFNLDSEGHCFFCLNKILVRALQSPKYSVHYLARFLKMDMAKVFNDKGQIDSSLLTKVRKSRLKVELCEKCTSLNKTFSGLYRQLEKLELEINSSLGLIREEFIGNGHNLPKSFSNSIRRNEVSEIVDVLRGEAIQKCSKKLRVVSPRVEIPKLTKKKIDAELCKHQTDSGIPKLEPEPEISSPEESPKERNIKMEFEPPIENVLSDDDNRNYDMDGEAMDEDHAITMEGPLGSDAANRQTFGTDAGNNKNSLVIISAANTPKTDRIGQNKSSFNSETGKWKCSACPMELTTYTGIRLHYKSVHQNIRFRCVPCGKEFTHRHHYTRHHQSVHVGLRFKCLVCNKIFSRKDTLSSHQRTAGCEKGIG